MKISIIDDDLIFANTLKKLMIPFCRQTFTSYEINTYNEISNINDIQSHLVFLDIDLKKNSGIELAKKIKSQYKETMIIFITSHNHLVYDALTIQPFYFIRKNNLSDDLTIAFSLIKSTLKSRASYEYIDNGIKKVIYLDDITYIDIDDHLTTVHTVSNINHSFYKPLKVLVSELNYNYLCQIHKKYYINIKRDLLIKGNSIIFNNGFKLTFGRKYKNNFLNIYQHYHKKEV